MTQPGPRPRAAAGRGLSASHLVSSANEGGGAGERQAEGHDREGDQGVEDAVHAESGHFRRSFFLEGRRRCRGRRVRCGRCLDSTNLSVA